MVKLTSNVSKRKLASSIKEMHERREEEGDEWVGKKDNVKDVIYKGLTFFSVYTINMKEFTLISKLVKRTPYLKGTKLRRAQQVLLYLVCSHYILLTLISFVPCPRANRDGIGLRFLLIYAFHLSIGDLMSTSTFESMLWLSL